MTMFAGKCSDSYCSEAGGRVRHVLDVQPDVPPLGLLRPRAADSVRADRDRDDPAGGAVTVDYELLWTLRCRIDLGPQDYLGRPASGPLAEILDLPIPERPDIEGGHLRRGRVNMFVLEGQTLAGEVGGLARWIMRDSLRGGD